MEHDQQARPAEPLHDDTITGAEAAADPFHWIADKAGELATIHAFLEQHPHEQTTITATHLVEISERARAAARDILLDGVRNNQVSRVRAGEILHVHQGTIARWLTAREVEQQSDAS